MAQKQSAGKKDSQKKGSVKKTLMEVGLLLFLFGLLIFCAKVVFPYFGML
jgi:hypothetical protein